MDQAKRLSEVIGEQLRAWRMAAGLRQDEVAREARTLGLRWTRATVAAVEGGRREVSSGEFVALPFIVEAFRPIRGGHWCRLASFVSTDANYIQLGPDAWITNPRESLIAVFSGKAPGKPPMLCVPTQSMRMWKSTPREARRTVDAGSDAEIKAADGLGISTGDLSQVARRLWKRTLTAERDERVARLGSEGASPRTLQAHRGHVTRTLIEELKRSLKQTGRKRR